MREKGTKEKPEEVIHAEKLIDEGKFDEALTFLNNCGQKERLSHHDKASCHLLQCQILYWQGKYKELIKHAEKAYKESEGLENNFLKVDSLLLTVRAFVSLEKFDEAFDFIRQGEELLKTFPQDLKKAYKQREAYLALVKGVLYTVRRGPNVADLALEHFEQSLLLREELGIKHEISESLSNLAFILIIYKAELDRALKYAERSLVLAKESSNTFLIAFSLNILGLIYNFKGELDHSHRCFEQSLELYKELNNKARMAAVLNNLSDIYVMRGELDRALEYIEQAMALNHDMGLLAALANNYDYLIQILLEKGDYERAQKSLHDLEQLSSQVKDKSFNDKYFLNKALLLKTSQRAIKRGKAEEILRKLVENEDLMIESRFRAVLNLCELLLTELSMTNDLEVLEELKKFVVQVVELAEKSKSYWVLCETYLLQAKFSLLNFNIKEAKRFLTQARQIAERFGLKQLVVKISSENDDLLKKLDLWEKLKEIDAPIADRLELARLDEKFVGIVQKHAVLTAQVSEEKVSVSKEKKICLVCRGEVLRFLFICECGAIYCENCVQALINLENVCWVCDQPIDHLKPVKPYMEEDRIKFEEKGKKK